MDPITNFAKCQLTQGYASGITEVVLETDDGAKLPQPSTDGAFNLVWWNATDYGDPADDPYREIVRCTARSSDTLTITRAQEGTSNNNHNIGGKTYKMILGVTKKTVDDIDSRLIALEPGGWKRIYDYVVPSATYYVDITGLNLDADISYMIVINHKKGTATGSLELYANGDYTATKYYCQRLLGDGAEVIASRLNTAELKQTLGNGIITGIMTRISGGFPTFVYSGTYHDAAAVIDVQNGAWVFNSAVNVTSLRIKNGGVGYLYLGAGTRITIFKRI